MTKTEIVLLRASADVLNVINEKISAATKRDAKIYQNVSNLDKTTDTCTKHKDAETNCVYMPFLFSNEGQEKSNEHQYSTPN